MSNNKQSSVEWLISQLKISTYWNNLISELELMECGEIDILEQAKAIHKQEIVEHHTWLLSGVMSETFAKKDAEKYYNENFGGNNESN